MEINEYDDLKMELVEIRLQLERMFNLLDDMERRLRK